jgi:hypothetical protein
MSHRALEELSKRKFTIPSISQPATSTSKIRLDGGIGPALCFLLWLAVEDNSAPYIGQTALVLVE